MFLDWRCDYLFGDERPKTGNPLPNNNALLNSPSTRKSDAMMAVAAGAGY